MQAWSFPSAWHLPITAWLPRAEEKLGQQEPCSRSLKQLPSYPQHWRAEDLLKVHCRQRLRQPLRRKAHDHNILVRQLQTAPCRLCNKGVTPSFPPGLMEQTWALPKRHFRLSLQQPNQGKYQRLSRKRKKQLGMRHWGIQTRLLQSRCH